MNRLFRDLFLLITIFIISINPVYAARDTNSFDGNIFPIYAGNGSLVPPKSTIEDSLKDKRTIVIIYYLDDSANSKEFAPVVSGLKLLWKSQIDLIPLTTDDFHGEITEDITNPAHYWHGKIPQVVVLNGEGEIINLDLSPDIIKEDKGIIEDLIMAAHNNAKIKLKSKTSEEISKATLEMGIPGLKFPF